MSGYTLTTTLPAPFDTTVERVREALAGEGFGVLTEIDVKATMKAKLGLDISPHLILGACNPALAHRALGIEPSLGALLPCNVVVRTADDGATIVEAIDPATMVTATGNAGLEPVATEVRERLQRALDRLTATALSR